MKVCEVDSCTGKVSAKGRCGKHYYRLRQGIPDDWERPRMQRCSIEWCDRPMSALTYCHLHYYRSKNGTDMNAPVQKQESEWSGWRLNADGYFIRVRGVNGKREQQFQHRVVMEEVVGRPLLKHETVHHKNGDRTDNRPENLELWSKKQPSGQRSEDKALWAREILGLYGTEEERGRYSETVRN